MPRGDKTGPEGKGPATGRGLGGCKTGKKKDATRRPRKGLARRGGRRGGRGYGN